MTVKTIKRIMQDDYQTLGELTVPDKDYSCKTIELPWKNNERQVSCIPEGTYRVKKRFSPRFENHFILEDVPNRDLILIHHGNYKKDVKGCILVGQDHVDIDGDRHLDVTGWTPSNANSPT